MGLKQVVVQVTIVVVIIAALIFTFFSIGEPTITGYAVFESSVSNVSYDVERVVLPQETYTIQLEDNVVVRGIVINGYYIASKDSSIIARLDEGTISHELRLRSNVITGMAIGAGEVESGMIEEDLANRTLLRYGDGPYDIDNDGMVGRQGAVDYYVETNASCVLWSIVGDDVDLFCQGTIECCDSYLLESMDDNPNYLVLDRQRAGADRGEVLAKADGYDFSRMLPYDFTGAEERLVRLDDVCLGSCNVRMQSSSIRIESSAYLHIDRIIVYYDDLPDDEIFDTEDGNIIEEVLPEKRVIREEMIEYIVYESEGGIIGRTVSELKSHYGLSRASERSAKIFSMDYEHISEEEETEYTEGINAHIIRVSSELLNLVTEESVRIIILNESGIYSEYANNLSELNEILHSKEVITASIDRQIELLTQDTLNASGFISVYNEYEVSGSGVRVCIVDTGVSGHVVENISYTGVNVLDGTDDIMDYHGHGTLVSYPLIRALPDAHYVIVKALDDTGIGYESDVISGLDACAEHDVDVVSLSIGAGLYDGYCDTNLVSERVNELVSEGVLVVSAAGNEAGPYLKAPSCASSALAVIAYTDDSLWYQSSYLEGHAVFAAPGVVETIGPDGSVVLSSGTSMSVPFVSAAAGLLVEYTNDTGLVLRNRLVGTGDLLGDEFLFSRLNVSRAFSGEITNELLYNISEGVEVEGTVYYRGTSFIAGTITTGNGHSCGIRAVDGRVLCWGRNNVGQIGDGTTAGPRTNPTLTTDTSAYTFISSGEQHSCGIRANDSRVLCWGSNGNGVLGDGTTVQRENPTLINDSSAYLTLGLGQGHSCGIRANDSRVLCWGWNGNGRLGDGTDEARWNPTLTSDTSAYSGITAGAHYSCGIRANDSRVLCWGTNNYGQLGDGTDVVRWNPTLTSDTSAYLHVSGGGWHSCGIRASDSRVLCWGRNNVGQIGDGTTTTPRLNPTLTTNTSAHGTVSAGNDYSCGIRVNDSRVLCWGANDYGRLGDGTTTGPRTNPTLTADSSAYVAVSAGDWHTCGIRSYDGRVLCWGYNEFGQIGDGTTTTPRQNPTLTSNMAPFAEIPWVFTTCEATGRTGPTQGMCDDAYEYSYLNNSVTVSSGIQSWTVPETGWYNVTAVGAQGGYGGRTGVGGYGALISGAFYFEEGETINVLVGQKGGDNSFRPAGGGGSAVWKDTGTELLIVAGGGGAYAVGTTTTYQDRAHASNTTSGKDGFGATAQSVGGTGGLGGAGTGNRASGGGGWFTDGGQGTTADSRGRSLSGGGLGGGGAVADGGFGGGGATDSTTTWGAASGGGGYSGGGGGYSNTNDAEGAGGGGGSYNSGLFQYNVGGENADHGLVIIEPYGDVSLLTVGVTPSPEANATDDLLGYCTSDVIDGFDRIDYEWRRDGIVEYMGTYFRADTITAHEAHTCGIRANDSRVLCWGRAGSGEIGNGSKLPQVLNPTLTSDTDPYLQVSVGFTHSCGIRYDGRVLCWGNNAEGQLGTNDTTERLVPTLIADDAAYHSLSAGYRMNCAIRANDSRVLCWGDNVFSQLGSGGGSVSVPRLINDTASYLMVSTYKYHACGIRANDSRVLCWGMNWYGQGGNGTTDEFVSSETPTLTTDSSPYVMVTTGASHTCGIRASDSRVLCWGRNNNGQLGIGSSGTNVGNPTTTSDSSAYHYIDAGWQFSCGIRSSDNRGLCWGDNGEDKLGIGTTGNRENPTLISASFAISLITAGERHGCVVRSSNGRVYCWGQTAEGRTGDGVGIGTEHTPTLTTDTSSYAYLPAIASGVQYNLSTLDSTITNGGDSWTFSCRITDGRTTYPYEESATITIANIIPIYSKFDGSTTNFSDASVVPDLSSVSNPILEISTFGRITWKGMVNVPSSDYDSHVHIGYRYIFVNSSALHSSHDSGSNLSFYDTGFVHAPVILKDSSVCEQPLCNMTGFVDGYVNYSVAGFSNYTLDSNSRLEIWDGTDPQGGNNSYEVGESVPFYANYSNLTSGEPISGSGNDCEIQFDTGSGYGSFIEMEFNATSNLYEYNTTFGSAGTFSYNVSCTSTQGYENLSVTNEFTYNPANCFDNSTSPIPICTCTDLSRMWENLTANYELQNNIDCSDTINWNDDEGWLPVGTTGTGFSGTLDGQGYNITDLFIARNNVGYQGLFGQLTTGGSITDLGLVNANITIKDTLSIVTPYIGILVGYIDGGSVSGSYVTNSILYSDFPSTGGLIGEMSGGSVVSSSFVSGSSVSSSTSNVGGLIGRMSGGSVSSSYTVDSSVSSTGSSVGGLVGYMLSGSVVSSSYTIGSNVSSTSTRVGGLVGRMWSGSSIVDSYSTSNVYALAGENLQYHGGLVGQNYRGVINNSYSTGIVNSTHDDSGGFVGSVDTGAATYGMYGNFWDNQTSGRSTSAGDNVTGLTTAQMYNISQFLAADWNISEISGYNNETWFIDDGNDYPRLWFEFDLALLDIESVGIIPSPFALDDENLVGYCSATGSENFTRLDYLWYKDDVVEYGGAYFKEGSISAGGEFSCGVRANDSRLLCWGANFVGKLGIGNTTHMYSPVLVDSSDAFLSVSVGVSHSCGVRANDSRVLCWGLNSEGQLGIGNTTDMFSPVLVDSSDAFLSVSLGSFHSCGVRANDSRVLCWGGNIYGQLGVGNTTDMFSPVLVDSSDAFLSVSLGSFHSCGVRANDSRVLCWGGNWVGQLGVGSAVYDSCFDGYEYYDCSLNPVLVDSSDAFLSVMVGVSHSCGVRASDSRLLCWGANANGQLGVGNTTDMFSPVLVDSSDAFLSVGLGFGHSCGVRASDSRVLCWGRNFGGQLGVGNTTSPIMVPVLVDSSDAFLSVDGGFGGGFGEQHTCGVRAVDGRVLCWGDGSFGALGTGNTSSQLSPTLTIDSSSYLRGLSPQTTYNVSLIGSGLTSLGEEWKLSCRAVNVTSAGDFVNSTVTTIDEGEEGLDCGVIDEPGEYIMNGDLAATGTCITINVSDVSLDCQGHTINYSTNDDEGYGILIWSQSGTVENVSIANCNIIKESPGGSSGSRRPAILGYGYSGTPSGGFTKSGDEHTVEQVNISNVTITTEGDYARGIFVLSGHTWSVEDVSITTYGDDARGIYSENSDHWSLRRVDITTFGTVGIGLYTIDANHYYLKDIDITAASAGMWIRTGSSNWRAENISINATLQGIATSDGGMAHMSFYNSTIHSSGSRGLDTNQGTDNISFYDSIITAPSSDDVYMRLGDASRRVTFVNVTFNPSSVTFHDSTSGFLDVGWYVDFLVNDTLSYRVENANISWQDSGVMSSLNPNSTGWKLTDSGGLSLRNILYEYSQNQTARYYHTNYSFDISSPSYASLVGASRNFTTNTQLDFTIEPLSLECGVISEPGSYVMTTNLTATGTCFTINVSDVILDCQDYTINYSTADEGYGILIWSQSSNVDNVTIQNCVVVQGSGEGDVNSARPGILGWGVNNGPSGGLSSVSGIFYEVTNVLVVDSSIVTLGDRSDAIRGAVSYDWDVVGVNVSTAGQLASGVFGTFTGGWLLSGVDSFTTGDNSRGFASWDSVDWEIVDSRSEVTTFYSYPIRAEEGSHGWVLSNVSLISDGFESDGLHVIDSDNWMVEGLFVSSSGTQADAFYLEDSDGWMVYDSDLSSGSAFDVVLNLSDSSYRVGFVNTSFDHSSVSLLTPGWLDRGWWVDAYVNDSLGSPVEDANVSWNDAGIISGNPSSSGWNVTDDSGLSVRNVLFEYSENQTARYYNTNYTINVSHEDYDDLIGESRNFTGNTQLNFTFLGESLECGVISEPGEYVMTSDLSAAGTCFTINVSDVSLDCGGHTINYSTGEEGYGILIWSQGGLVENVNVSNCNIVKDSEEGNSSSLRPALLVYGRSAVPSGSISGIAGTAHYVDNVSINNVNASSKGNYSSGIFIVRGWYSSISNVMVDTDGNWSFGIWGDYSSYWNIYNTSIFSLGLFNVGLYGVDSNFWVLDSLNVDVEFNDGHGIIGFRSNSWILYNVTVIADGSTVRGISLWDLNNWTVIDSFIDSTFYDINMELDHSTRQAFFINTSFNKSSVYFTNANAGWLNRGWWVDSYVNDTIGNPISGANVSWVDNGSLASNPSASGYSLTLVDGTVRNAIFEYSQNQTHTFEHNNYTFNASKEGFLHSDIVQNITDNAFIYFTLETDDIDPPTWSDPWDNSTDTSPRINENIRMNLTLNDDVDLFSYTFSWNGTGSWTNDSIQLISGTEHILSVIKQVGLPRDNTIGWRVYFNDSAEKTNISDIFTFTVKNTPPDVPILNYPLNDSDIYNRTPLFNWTGFDADSDELTYNLTIYCIGGCSADNRHYQGITTNEFQLEEELQFLYDDGYSYLWSVNACDQYECSEYSQNNTFTLSSLLSVRFTQNDSDFGMMQLGQTNSTEDNSPNPLVLVNEGNVKVNISFYAQTPLFERAALPSPFFEARIRPLIGNYGIDTNTSWFDLDDSENPAHMLRKLNYTTDNNATIDLRVTVPIDEPPAERSSTITAMVVMS
ncbi:MAG: hypothetical protein ACMXYL_00265 [Candidatus Woesearchaeota archaeon]